LPEGLLVLDIKPQAEADAADKENNMR
jgi:hypothetical protein